VVMNYVFSGKRIEWSLKYILMQLVC